MQFTFRHLGRRTSLATAATLALVSGPAAAQDGSLCDALDMAQLDALGAPRYVESPYGGESLCLLEAAPEQEGPHTISLWLNELPFGMTIAEVGETMREQNPGLEDVTIGEHEAVLDRESPDGANLVVGLGELGLTVMVNIAESAEAGDLDEGDYAVSVAELAVAGLESSSSGVAATGPVPEPPTVDGVTWRTGRALAGAALDDELGEIELEMLNTLLATAGTGSDQAAMLDATAFDAESDERLGNYIAISITGADASALAPALVEWLASLQGDDSLGAAGATLAGREVTEISRDGEPQGYIYAEGDTLYLISMPAEAAEAIVEALP